MLLKKYFWNCSTWNSKLDSHLSENHKPDVAWRGFKVSERRILVSHIFSKHCRFFLPPPLLIYSVFCCISVPKHYYDGGFFHVYRINYRAESSAIFSNFSCNSFYIVYWQRRQAGTERFYSLAKQYFPAIIQNRCMASYHPINGMKYAEAARLGAFKKWKNSVQKILR